MNIHLNDKITPDWETKFLDALKPSNLLQDNAFDKLLKSKLNTEFIEKLKYTIDMIKNNQTNLKNLKKIQLAQLEKLADNKFKKNPEIAKALKELIKSLNLDIELEILKNTVKLQKQTFHTERDIRLTSYPKLRTFLMKSKVSPHKENASVQIQKSPSSVDKKIILKLSPAKQISVRARSEPQQMIKEVERHQNIRKSV